ncbi:hypothetical protein OAS86_00545 [Gammaproteobacteria bacterium]|nr:hypothetical protein [Gammaproteobacteria bacterium]
MRRQHGQLLLFSALLLLMATLATLGAMRALQHSLRLSNGSDSASVASLYQLATVFDLTVLIESKDDCNRASLALADDVQLVRCEISPIDDQGGHDVWIEVSSQATTLIAAGLLTVNENPQWTLRQRVVFHSAALP